VEVVNTVAVEGVMGAIAIVTTTAIQLGVGITTIIMVVSSEVGEVEEDFINLVVEGEVTEDTLLVEGGADVNAIAIVGVGTRAKGDVVEERVARARVIQWMARQREVKWFEGRRRSKVNGLYRALGDRGRLLELDRTVARMAFIMRKKEVTVRLISQTHCLR